ncbi:NIL domain-containing protein [Persephonella hydrogeniphila]|uniref:NIL domain-containing protein n=1 Tax=Persephonella hydrogeniphila TaxID=198703 RepID=A0A285NJ37_9AQUI|nr:NIL domain-containing protein [Persephonella hydrogeniphila]SNZ09469.1 NIL domain-containing protein [Persephonella hydrogeniphila]
MESIKLKLIYPEDKIKEPILSKVCKNFDVEINIRKANVTENIGWLELELTGDEKQIEEAIKFMESQGIEVSPLEGQVFME